MEQDARGIRGQSATYPKVQNLIHCVNEEALMEKHVRQSRRKAAGVDGVNKDAYGKDAEGSIA